MLLGQGGPGRAPGVEREQLHVVVSGRVQGVGYRAFVTGRARALGVAGWVCNRSDGSVEVLALAPAGVLGAFEDALRRGPTNARVETVTRLRRKHAAVPGKEFSVVRCPPGAE